MPRSPSSTPATVVDDGEVASSPKPGLFARLFKKAPKVDDVPTPSPEKPRKKKRKGPKGPNPLSCKKKKKKKPGDQLRGVKDKIVKANTDS